MCIWCEKDAGVTPMVSGARMPMICKECGTRVCTYGWQELRDIMNQYERRINKLEKELGSVKLSLELRS